MPQNKICGAVFIVAAGMMLLAMMHHPLITTSEPSEIVSEIIEFRRTDQIVHGGMIGLLILTFFAFQNLTSRLDAWSCFASTLYAFGTGGFIGAALISGFVVPELATIYLDKDPSIIKDLLRLAYAFNQALSKFGTVMIGGALIAVGIDMIQRSGLSRWAGAAGLICGGGSVLAMLAGMSLGLHEMTVVVAAFALFYVFAGVWLWRRSGNS